MNGFNYYRIKTGWLGEANDAGQLKRLKTEELVFASSYTEAEQVAHKLVHDHGRAQFSTDFSIEIIKTKIDGIIYNNILRTDNELINGLVSCYFEEGDETGVGLYGVKVMFITADEKTGKEKRGHKTLYIPATSNTAATKMVNEHLTRTLSSNDFVVRDAKFDPTSAIIWPKEIYQNLVESLN